MLTGVAGGALGNTGGPLTEGGSPLCGNGGVLPSENGVPTVGAESEYLPLSLGSLFGGDRGLLGGVGGGVKLGDLFLRGPCREPIVT